MKPLFHDWGQNNGIQVVWEETPYSTTYEKTLNDAQTGTGAYDIYNMDDPWVPVFAGGGFLTSLTQMGFQPDSDFQQQSIDVGYWPPKTGPRVPGPSATQTPELYALPWVGDVNLAFWRTDLGFKKPETWAEVMDVAKQTNNPSSAQYGWVTTGVKGNPIISNWWEILYAFGGQVFDDSWNVIVNNEKGINALQFLLDMKQYCPPGVTGFGYTEEYAALFGGRASTSLVWTGFCSDADNPAKSKIVGKWEVGAPPKGEQSASEIGLWIAGISSASKNRDAAFQLMNYWASSDAQIAYARLGGTPVKRSAYLDQQAVAKARYLPGILSSLDVAVARPRTPEWAKIEDLLGTRVNEAFVAGQGAKGSLDTAAGEIRDYLTTMGYYS